MQQRLEKQIIKNIFMELILDKNLEIKNVSK